MSCLGAESRLAAIRCKTAYCSLTVAVGDPAMLTAATAIPAKVPGRIASQPSIASGALAVECKRALK